MTHEYNGTGFIEVICGPMFAGKSEELLRRINRLIFAKKKFLVFKPTIDDPDLQVVSIDEVQFFDDAIITVVNTLANRGIRVICAGLDCDFKGEPFPVTANLLALAEDVTKLTAICAVCGKEATMTQRLVDGEPAKDSDPVVLVGAKESYEPRCRKCHCVRHE